MPRPSPTQPTIGLGPTLRQWFGPPRAHGEIDDSRVVSFLELFYDLVFVVLVAQIAHTLAGNVTWAGVGDFATVFALLWLAWLNGTLYHELHGREDGRSRTFIFTQMMVLVVMSVYTGHAADSLDDGRGFAITYTVLLALLGLQWFGVRRHDSPEFAPLVTRYVLGLAGLAGVMIVSAVVDDLSARRWLWAIGAIVMVVLLLVRMLSPDEVMDRAIHVTESMAERFGLFTIIVLGEVVVGVVDGLSEAERTTRTVATGVLALSIGFGFWWNYFDFIGRRQPRSGSTTRTIWMLGHLPLTVGIAAAGAGMVSLIEHAADGRTPGSSAWLIAGATAVMATALAALVSTMGSHAGRRLVPVSLLAVSGVALVLGALRPPPLILALALSLSLLAVWAEAFARHARNGLPLVEE
jgi:low temperature requirement protein LtrA